MNKYLIGIACLFVILGFMLFTAIGFCWGMSYSTQAMIEGADNILQKVTINELKIDINETNVVDAMFNNANFEEELSK